MNQEKPIYVFIGPPGSGKGTLAQLCQQRLGWHSLSTGDLCRSHVASQTEIGKQIDFCIKSGKLISDALVVQMVHNWLDENLQDTHGLILDGFPRTREQAQTFEQILYQLPVIGKLHVLELYLHDKALIQRLTGRRVCSNQQCQTVYTYAKTSLAPRVRDVCDVCHADLIQRDDDKPEVVTKRLQTYHENAQPLLSFYRERPEFLGILQADKPVDDVYQAFRELTQSS